MKKKVWKRFITAAVCAMMLCSGCGNNKSDQYSQDFTQNEIAYDDYYADSTEAALEGVYADENDSVEYMSEAGSSVESSEKYDSGIGNNAPEPIKGNTNSAIKKEMLVYRGDLCIDTLEFDNSVRDFKTIIEQKGGFVESESYSDTSSTSGYYAVDERKKHNLYTATVRVPSAEYDAIMNASTTLGDVRSRYSNATNVTQQYSTYKSQLEIYEAEYERYLTLLESATEDEYALQIENELFDIQIQIAELKSGITNIENDVAYSYIDITIKEVQEYVEEPEETDTFFDRFKLTCKESWKYFLNFMEGLLFWIIRNIFAIVFIVIVVIVVRVLFKKRKKAKLVKQNVQGADRMQVNQMPVNPVMGNQVHANPQVDATKTNADNEVSANDNNQKK